MLISLDKNKWLFDWIQDNWQDDLYNIITVYDTEVTRPNEVRSKIVQICSKGHKTKVTSKNDIIILMKENEIRSKIAQMLCSKGYKTKVISKHNIIISMTEEEFIFLKLKYS